jgi:hypothetical protein
MDVNLDGKVSAGDVSQINQRAVLIIPEFKQAWNHDINGVSNGEPSKDWEFIDSVTVSTNAAFVISSTYPLDNGTGYSKNRVPQLAFCLPIRVTNFGTCPDYVRETYVGILVGDVNGNVATASPSNQFKSETSKVIFDMNRATVNGNVVEIPVKAVSVDAINSLDFSFGFNENNMAFVSANSSIEGMDALSHFNTDDRKVRFTSYSLNAFEAGVAHAKVAFTFNSAVSVADFNNAFAYLNGEQAEVEFVGDIATGISAYDYNEVVSVFPNPAKDVVRVLVPEAANVQLMDAAGRAIGASYKAVAGQSTVISTSDLSSGVYFVSVSNDGFSIMKKIVVAK